MWRPQAHIPVDAPAEEVWKVMLRLDGCGVWNPFIIWSARPLACPCGSASASLCRSGARAHASVSPAASTAPIRRS
jgi:hypothetical protein